MLLACTKLEHLQWNGYETHKMAYNFHHKIPVPRRSDSPAIAFDILKVNILGRMIASKLLTGQELPIQPICRDIAARHMRECNITFSRLNFGIDQGEAPGCQTFKISGCLSRKVGVQGVEQLPNLYLVSKACLLPI